MESNQTINFVLGGLFLLVGGLLAFAKVDTANLAARSHTNPGLALFRFPLSRWGAVVVLVALGAGLILIGLGKVGG
jgi:uncharacterized membrane protein